MQMANKRISELPLLSPDNLNPSAAYIIVEQGGVTYKMPALGFGGASAASETLLDFKSTDLYSPSNEKPTVTFNYDGINNNASAWRVEIITTSTQDGRLSNVRTIDQTRASSFTKFQGLTAQSLSGMIGSFSSNGYVSRKGVVNYDNVDFNYITEYYVNINTQNNSQVTLSFSSKRSVPNHPWSQSDGSGWPWERYSGIRANIQVNISGTISA